MPHVAPVNLGLAARIDGASARVLAVSTGLVALVVRVLYWAIATPDRRLISDAAQYHYLATNVSEGRGFVDTFPQLALHPTAFRPPGYPGVLAVVYTILWPSPGIARGLNVAIGVAVVAALTLLVHRHLGPRAAVAAGLSAALLPNFIANDTYVLTEPLSLLLLIGLLWCLVEKRWLTAGLITGLLILTRPSAQYLVLLLAIYVVWRAGWKRAALYLVIALAVVAPWVVRNWVQLGSPVLVTSNGFNYAALYSPPADERGGFIDPIRHDYFDGTRFDQFDEIVWDRNLRKTAVDNIRDHPAVVPEVMGSNARAMFELAPSFNRDAERLDGRSRGVRQWTYWVIWPLVVLGVAGAIRERRRPIVLLSAVIGAYFTLASLVFVAPPRLRAPMELMLIIIAAALLARRGDVTESDEVAEPAERERETEPEPKSA